MQFANYFFASIISFLGLVMGFILLKIAPEEQKPLQKYFKFASKFFMLLIFIFLAFYYSYSSFYILGLVICCALLLYLRQKTKNPIKKSMVTYAAFGFLFFLGSKDAGLFVFVSSLMLLYGILESSMIDVKARTHERLFANNLVFILIANILPFLSP